MTQRGALQSQADSSAWLCFDLELRDWVVTHSQQ